jgi:hypothetical protein
MAVAQQADGARRLTEQCAARLRERFWDGDEELAAELEAALGTTPGSTLAVLPVDLDEVADVLDASPSDGGVIDLTTGDVWTRSMIDDTDEVDDEQPDFDDDTRWLYVAADGPGEGYRDMADFVAAIDDPDIADRLAMAIDGKGAFRRFRDLLQRWEQVEDDWYRFSDERRRGRARSWLASVGYRPKPPEPTAGP